MHPLGIPYIILRTLFEVPCTILRRLVIDPISFYAPLLGIPYTILRRLAIDPILFYTPFLGYPALFYAGFKNFVISASNPLEVLHLFLSNIVAKLKG